MNVEGRFRWINWRRVGLRLVVVVGYASLAFSIMIVPTGLRWGPGVMVAWWLGCALMAAFAIHRRGFVSAETAFEVLVLGALPLWGGILNESLSPCRVDACDDLGIQRPFSTPGLYWFLGLHLLCALGYLVARRRPRALEPRAEAMLLASLMIGVGVAAIATIQTVLLLPYLLALPLTLPLVSPALSFGLMLKQLRARLRDHARDALQVAVESEPALSNGAGANRRGRSGAVRLAGWLPLPLVGLYAALEGAVVGRADAFVSVVTQTCSHPLSLGTLEVLHQKSCHYLCTVAAHGHTALVRPLRLGTRGGQLIVVNRQLQVANAFEDLLHERWPRFGALARRLYDRIGLPISRWIRSPLASDLVYLAMKPAEWAFYLALLLLDPDAPEARIGRMYR